jgi:hypothetical protein
MHVPPSDDIEDIEEIENLSSHPLILTSEKAGGTSMRKTLASMT